MITILPSSRTETAYSSTSVRADGVLPAVRGKTGVSVASLGLSEASTTNGYTFPVLPYGTAAGPAQQLPTSAVGTGSSGGAAVLEIRRLSSHTWEELSELMGVTRRTLHHWANGKPATAGKERHLQRLLGALRLIDRGEARLNRNAIMNVSADGSLPYDLLKQKEFDEFVRQVGRGNATRSPGGPSHLDDEERVRRRPPAPADLLEALQDDAPRAGRTLTGKAVRLPRK